MVKNAWNEAMRLAGLAAEGLTTLANTYPASGANIPEVMSNIAHTSPALVSMNVFIVGIADFSAEIGWRKFSEVKMDEYKIYDQYFNA